MKLFTIDQYEQLLKNGSNPRKDYHPIIKIDIQNSTWLLTELDPESPNYAFGLIIPNNGFSTLQQINLNELTTIENRVHLRVDCDFKAKYPVSVYQSAEWFYGVFVGDEKSLGKFFDEPLEGTQLKFF